METTDTQIDRDVNALKDDVSSLRNDFAALLRSLHYRARNLAADSRNKAQKWTAKVRSKPAATETTGLSVEEPRPGPGARRRRLVIKRPGISGRTLLLFFTLGMVAALLAMRKRETVIIEQPQPRRGLRSKLMTMGPGAGGSRDRAAQGATSRESTDRLIRPHEGRGTVAQEQQHETEPRIR